MWLPIRSQSVPSHAVYGYSINQVTVARFPDAGQYGVDSFPGYESFFEALDTVGVDSTTDIMTLDFLPKKKGSFRDSFNKVQHYKRTVLLVDAPFTFASRESGVKWENYGSPVVKFWDSNLCLLAIDPVLAFGPAEIPIMGLPALWRGTDLGVYNDDDGLFGVACENILRGIRPVSSQINSVYELKDIKTIPHTLSKINSALDRLRSLLRGKAKDLFTGGGLVMGRKTLRSILNAGADVYLQDNFNVKPLLQDITNAVFSVNNVEQKLKQLLAHARQPQTAHWGRTLDGFDSRNDVLHTTGRPSDQDADVVLKRVVTYGSARFQATIEYSYEMPDGSYQENLVRGIMDYNGLTLSPQVIWNAIPWSFVIDWIVGVGPWLSQFTGRQLEIVTHVSKAGWSVKIEREIAISSNLTGLVGTTREESYYRTPSRVPLINSLRVSGINPKEFSLGAA